MSTMAGVSEARTSRRATTVVKIGGSVERADALLDELAAHGGRLIIVHGAHRVLDALATRLGNPPRMVTSERGDIARYTDAVTMDHFLMAYAGQVNKRLVEALRRRAANAVGISAMDGGVAVGRRRASLRIREGERVKVLHDNFTGSIDTINPHLLETLLDAGYVPVLTPPAISDDGHAINVDGDRLAAAIAVAVGAERLMIFSDTAGLLRDPGDDTSVITRIPATRIGEYGGVARGRAMVKVRAAAAAVSGGVSAVGLVDGRGENPLTRALAGAGTWIAA